MLPKMDYGNFYDVFLKNPMSIPVPCEYPQGRLVPSCYLSGKNHLAEEIWSEIHYYYYAACEAFSSQNAPCAA